MPSGTDLKQFGIPKSAIQALTETSTLLPLFEVQVTRYRWVLHREEGVIELAFDKGTVAGLVPDQSGAEPVAVNELEFELVSGSPKALWTIASEFLRWMPDRCGLEPRSKAQRGLESVFAQKVKKSNRIRSRPSLVNKIPLNHGENQDHDLGTVLRHHLQTATVSLSHLVVQAQRRINPEDVHQSRVALRQIRTLLKLLVAAGYPVPAQDLLPRCAALADELGALRDLDVLTESLLDPLHQKLPHDRAFTALCKAVREHQSQVRLRVRQHLADTEVPLLLCDLGLLGESLPDSPVGQSTTEFARTEADRLRKKIRRRQRACQTMPSAEADHRLRLAHKALRYASPLLRDLKAPQDLTAWAKASAKAQEALGLAQDKATALQTIALALQAQPTAPAARERALALIEGYLLAE
jgi:adenylate cyclase